MAKMTEQEMVERQLVATVKNAAIAHGMVAPGSAFLTGHSAKAEYDNFRADGSDEHAYGHALDVALRTIYFSKPDFDWDKRVQEEADLSHFPQNALPGWRDVLGSAMLTGAGGIVGAAVGENMFLGTALPSSIVLPIMVGGAGIGAVLSVAHFIQAHAKHWVQSDSLDIGVRELCEYHGMGKRETRKHLKIAKNEYKNFIKHGDEFENYCAQGLAMNNAFHRISHHEKIS